MSEDRDPLTGGGGGGEVLLTTALGDNGDAAAGLVRRPASVGIGVGVAVAGDPSVLLTALEPDVASTAVPAAVAFPAEELGDSSVVEAPALLFAVVTPLTGDEPLSVELLAAVLSAALSFTLPLPAVELSRDPLLLLLYAPAEETADVLLPFVLLLPGELGPLAVAASLAGLFWDIEEGAARVALTPELPLLLPAACETGPSAVLLPAGSSPAGDKADAKGDDGEWPLELES